MQQERNPQGKKNPSRQQVPRRARQNNSMEIQSVQRDVSQLSDLLNRERAHCNAEKNEKMLISAELEETKKQLAKQKALKEMYINKGKDTQRDLDRLQKYSKEETLCTTRIATQVRNTSRQKKKKHLHADYEELQVAHLISNQKFEGELQGEREKNRLLQEELDRMKVSHHELSLRYETDILSARQQAETLQGELQQQMQAHADRASQDQQVIMSLRAEQDDLRQRMAEEVATLQQKAFEKEKMFWTELEELKTQLSVQKIVQKDYEDLHMKHKLSKENFSAQLQEEKNKTQGLQEELERCKASNKLKYESNTLTLQQQAESVQRQLETQIKSQSDKLSESQQLILNMRAEQEALRQKMVEEVNILQQHSTEKESCLLRRLQELQTHLNIQLQKNVALTKELQADREYFMPPKRKKARRQEQPEEMELDPPSASAPVPMEETGENVPETKKEMSLWKQARHFLGLRKPQSWKNK